MKLLRERQEDDARSKDDERRKELDEKERQKKPKREHKLNEMQGSGGSLRSKPEKKKRLP